MDPYAHQGLRAGQGSEKDHQPHKSLRILGSSYDVSIPANFIDGGTIWKISWKVS